MATLNVHYQDMKEDVLEQAKKVRSSWHLWEAFDWYGSCPVQTILDSFEQYKEERIIANKIRQDFDKNYGKSTLLWFAMPPKSRGRTCNWRERVETNLVDWNVGESWNCVVGKNFGSHVVHQSRSYMFACLNEEISILLWKAAWSGSRSQF